MKLSLLALNAVADVSRFLFLVRIFRQFPVHRVAADVVGISAPRARIIVAGGELITTIDANQSRRIYVQILAADQAACGKSEVQSGSAQPSGQRFQESPAAGNDGPSRVYVLCHAIPANRFCLIMGGGSATLKTAYDHVPVFIMPELLTRMRKRGIFFQLARIPRLRIRVMNHKG